MDFSTKYNLKNAGNINICYGCCQFVKVIGAKICCFRRNMDFSMIGLENFRHQIGFCKVLIFFSKLRFCHLQVICNEIDESISSTKQTKKILIENQSSQFGFGLIVINQVDRSD